MTKWSVLGIHGADVRTVDGNVARVRFFLQDENTFVDADVPLPKLPKGIGIPSSDVYEAILEPTLDLQAVQLRAEAGIVDQEEVVSVIDAGGDRS